MSTPNLSIELQGILAVSNQLAQIPPYIVNYDFGNPTCSATVQVFEPFFQAQTTGGSITLPVSPAFVVIVQNLSQTGALLNVIVTPAGGAPQTYKYGQGGIFVHFDPLETGGGITALTIQSVAAGPLPAMVFVGG